MEAYDGDTLMGACAQKHVRALLLFGDVNQRIDESRNPGYTRAPWVSKDAPDLYLMDDDSENDHPATGALPSTAVEQTREPETTTIHRMAFPQEHRRQTDCLHSLRALGLWFGQRVVQLSSRGELESA